MNDSEVLRLVFNTTSDKTATVSIKYPKGNLDDNAVVTAMDTIIGSSAISEKNGTVDTRKSATLITTVATEIQLPQMP